MTLLLGKHKETLTQGYGLFQLATIEIRCLYRGGEALTARQEVWEDGDIAWYPKLPKKSFHPFTLFVFDILNNNTKCLCSQIHMRRKLQTEVRNSPFGGVARWLSGLRRCIILRP